MNKVCLPWVSHMISSDYMSCDNYKTLFNLILIHFPSDLIQSSLCDMIGETMVWGYYEGKLNSMLQKMCFKLVFQFGFPRDSSWSGKHVSWLLWYKLHNWLQFLQRSDEAQQELVCHFGKCICKKWAILVGSRENIYQLSLCLSCMLMLAALVHSSLMIILMLICHLIPPFPTLFLSFPFFLHAYTSIPLGLGSDSFFFFVCNLWSFSWYPFFICFPLRRIQMFECD